MTNPIRTDEPLGIQIGDLRLLVKQANRYGARLQVRERLHNDEAPVLLVGRDALSRQTSVEGTPAFVADVLGDLFREGLARWPG